MAWQWRTNTSSLSAESVRCPTRGLQHLSGPEVRRVAGDLVNVLLVRHLLLQRARHRLQIPHRLLLRTERYGRQLLRIEVATLQQRRLIPHQVGRGVPARPALGKLLETRVRPDSAYLCESLRPHRFVVWSALMLAPLVCLDLPHQIVVGNVFLRIFTMLCGVIGTTSIRILLHEVQRIIILLGIPRSSFPRLLADPLSLNVRSRCPVGMHRDPVLSFPHLLAVHSMLRSVHFHLHSNMSCKIIF